MDRRAFLAGIAPAVAAGAQRRRVAPLPRPAFYWGVGIENCWMAQTDPARDGNRRLLDVFLQMDHYNRWKEDLRLAADLGINTIRYSVPWYKAEPSPGKYDWSWIDKPIDYLVNKLRIIPVMDLIHYGTPAWMPDGVMDRRFPEAIGQYAGAMAKDFQGLVNHYSPHNEPQVTCWFCGMTGRWPPYRKSVESWSRIGIQAAKGMVLETEAIRAAIPDSVIISVETFLFDQVATFLPAEPTENLRKAAAVYPASLAYGKVAADDAFGQFLQRHAVTADEIDWFRKRPQPPDLLGYNYYPDIFAFRKDGDFTRKGVLPIEKAAAEAADLVAVGTRMAHSFFNLPVYIAETSAGLSDPAKVAFIHALSGMARRLRREGIPLIGINWWPLFETIQWDYREKPERPLKDFIYKGGWNNGLYNIDLGRAGLQRV